MVCQKLCQNGVSGWGSLEERVYFAPLLNVITPNDKPPAISCFSKNSELFLINLVMVLSFGFNYHINEYIYIYNGYILVYRMIAKSSE